MPDRDLVGRDEERQLARRLLERGSTVVLGGHAGVGKTTLARHLAAWWAADDRPVEWVSATATTSALPFAAVARLLGPVGEIRTDRVTDRTFDLIRSAVDAARDQPDRLLIVDDGHHLDPSSALLVHHLAHATGQVLVTIRTGEPIDPALTVLWEDEHATRIDLVGLSEGETRRAMEHLLDGPIDDDTAERLYAASQGNPLLLRQLTQDAVDAGGLQLLATQWRWDGSVGRARRLRDTITASLDAAGPEARRIVLLLSLGRPLRLEILTRLVDERTIDATEDRGLLEVRQEGRRTTVELGHPMLGEVLLTSIDPAELDDVRVELADALASDPDRSAAERLLEARLRIDAGRIGSARSLARAADLAIRLGDSDLGTELATLALANGAGDTARLLLADAHFAAGRIPEAAAAFETAIPELTSDATRVRAAIHLHHTYVNLGDYVAAAEIYERVASSIEDPVWSAVLEGNALQHEYMRGNTRRSLERAEAILAEHDDPRVLVRLVSSIASGRALGGSTESATAFVDEVLPHALAMSDVLPLAPMWALNAHALTLLVAGRIHDARAMVDSLSSTADTQQQAAEYRAFLRLYLGRVELTAGHAAAALDLLSDVADAMYESDLSGQHHWARSLTAECRALLGDVTGARRDRDLALAGARRTEVYEGDAARARAWVCAAEGSIGEAIDELLHVADLQELEGQHGLAVMTLDDALRLGAGGDILDRQARLLPDIDGNWAHALGVHLVARRSGDGNDLLAASDAYVEMGADLHAAEAAAEAARAFDAAGLRARTAAAAVRRDEALARTGPVSSPALLDGPARAMLTRREPREVATLAAQGLTNREIAERLYVSVRTAEGHLLRASTKLGVSARTELAAALGAIADHDADENA